jgi:hypothetical protein
MFSVASRNQPSSASQRAVFSAKARAPLRTSFLIDQRRRAQSSSQNQVSMKKLGSKENKKQIKTIQQILYGNAFDLQ